VETLFRRTGCQKGKLQTEIYFVIFVAGKKVQLYSNSNPKLLMDTEEKFLFVKQELN
jgi:hypothetical protein